MFYRDGKTLGEIARFHDLSPWLTAPMVNAHTQALPTTDGTKIDEKAWEAAQEVLKVAEHSAFDRAFREGFDAYRKSFLALHSDREQNE